MNSNAQVAILNNTRVFFALKECRVHGYVAHQKSTLAEGSCQILESTEDITETPNDEKVYYLQVDTFIEVLNNSKIFVRINYPENTTYLFENGSGQMVSVSFNKETENLDKFENHFSNFAVILDFNSQNINAELKLKIDNSCPPGIQTKDVSNDAKSYIKKIGKNVGSFIGTVSSYVEKPMNSAGSAVSERANSFTRDSVGEETKSKWNGVVQKSKTINETMSNAIRPAMNVYNNTVDAVGEKFYNSNNSFIKAVREYSLALASSLNEGKKKSSTKTEEPANQLKEEVSEMQLK